MGEGGTFAIIVICKDVQLNNGIALHFCMQHNLPSHIDKSNVQFPQNGMLFDDGPYLVWLVDSSVLGWG